MEGQSNTIELLVDLIEKKDQPALHGLLELLDTDEIIHAYNHLDKAQRNLLIELMQDFLLFLRI